MSVMTSVRVNVVLWSFRTLLEALLVVESVGFKNWAEGYANFRFRVATCGFPVSFSQTCTPTVIFEDHVICLCSSPSLRTLFDVVLSLPASCFRMKLEAILVLRLRVPTCVVFTVEVFADSVL